MLDTQKIPIAKILAAFNLTLPEIESLLDHIALANIFYWHIWEIAHKKFWQVSAIRSRDHYKLPFTPYPEIPPELVIKHHNAWKSRMTACASELVYALKVDDIIAGLEYIISETYENPATAFSKERKAFYERLKEVEDGFEWNITLPIDHEKFEEMLNNKAYHLGKHIQDFISEMFVDTVFVNKSVAVQYLVECGLPLYREVKGLSRLLYNRIANLSKQNIEATQIADTVVSLTNLSQLQSPIEVPKSLWAGKTKEAICSAMRSAGFDADVIAHILLFKRNLKLSQRELGEILSQRPLSESAYDKMGKSLAQKAADIQITDI